MRIAILAATLTALPLPLHAEAWTWAQRNTDFPPAFPEQFRAATVDGGVALERTTLADGLEHPWGIARLPADAGWLVTERPGRLRHVAPDGTVGDPVQGIPEVVARNQGGLLDVALDPGFADNRVIYLTYAKPVTGGSVTAAARMVLSEDRRSVSGVEDIFVQTPNSPTPMHYGSRVVPLPDGTLAITAGEHSSRSERVFAQDLDKTFGKVIRIRPDGSIPDDNPFVGVEGARDEIWSYGHRNPQGLAVDADGTLWAIEHGPKGGDELNRPEAGANYGWPVVSYGENYVGTAVGSGRARAEGMEEPVYFWDPVIAPAGMDFHSGEAFAEWNGDALIASLRPGGVVRLGFGEDGLVEEEERLLLDLGRVRDVEVQPDGSLVVLTDFEDGWVVHVTPAG